MTPSSSPSKDQRSSAPESENTPQWRVSPAPDGRGTTPEDQDKPPFIPRDRPWLWWLFGALLLLNLVFVFASAGSATRTKVPYQPFFVQQLQAGNVKSISSLQDSVDGQLKRAVRYDPPGQAGPVDVTNFKTQIPAYIDPAYLTQMVSSQDVVVTAKAEDTGRAFWANLLLGVLPTLLFMGFFLWLLRQQHDGQLRQVDRAPRGPERPGPRDVRRRRGDR
jgi:cell division protease FtsH